MCDCDAYDSPAVFEEVTRRARKRHRCGECRGLIEPGTAYHESRGLWDGQWSTHKTCGSCFVIANTLLDCYAFGDLVESLDCELDLSDRSSPARDVVAGMKLRRRAAERTLRREAAHEAHPHRR
jgi:hypothetical protein